MKINKEAYSKMVKFVLSSMLKLWKEDESYSFITDLDHYYLTTIKKEYVLDKEEFEKLVIEVLEENNIAKGTLT